MLDNHIYNLMEQIVQESQSLKRIDKYYPEDAKDCSQCKELWDKMKEEKEKNIEKIYGLIKGHISEQ